MIPVAEPPTRLIRQVPTLTQVAVVGLGAAAATATLTLIDPNKPGHYPVCPTFALTGLYCPGCGSLRALHDLAVGDFAGAWSMNPLVVLSVPYLIWAWAAWLRRVVTGKPRAFLAPGWVPLALAVGILAFGVARNVPGWELLAPH